MPEQPAPDFPLPYMPEHQPPKKVRRRYKFLVLAFAVTGLALVAAVSAYLWMHKSDGSPGGDSPGIRSVTYYYRDGKTVLWQGSTLSGPDSPTFVYAVADELTDRYGAKTMSKPAEWKITTTLDQSLQEAAKQQIKAQREQMGRQNAQEGALIAQDVTTGQIVSWVGNLDDKIVPSGNDRLSSRTQPGTLALPLVYAAWIDNSTVNAETTVVDAMEPLPGYPCTTAALCLQNFDRKYLGQMTLRQALGGLRLVPAVKAMVSVVPNDDSLGSLASINKTISVIEALMGSDNSYSCYTSDANAQDSSPAQRVQCFAAAAVGDGVYATPQDMIGAYATLSNHGKRLPQTGVLKLELNGKVIHEWKASDDKQAVKSTTSTAINDILSDASSSYIAQKSYFSVGTQTQVSTITGVTSDGTTYAAVQYTPRYAVGFWGFGGQAPNEAIKGFSEAFTLPVTHGWLTAAHENAD
jgi:membrane peptidoglycan carboxypeptidase